jgi:hypothetical protein
MPSSWTTSLDSYCTLLTFFVHILKFLHGRNEFSMQSIGKDSKLLNQELYACLGIFIWLSSNM